MTTEDIGGEAYDVSEPQAASIGLTTWYDATMVTPFDPPDYRDETHLLRVVPSMFTSINIRNRSDRSDRSDKCLFYKAQTASGLRPRVGQAGHGTCGPRSTRYSSFSVVSQFEFSSSATWKAKALPREVGSQPAAVASRIPVSTDLGFTFGRCGNFAMPFAPFANGYSSSNSRPEELARRTERDSPLYPSAVHHCGSRLTDQRYSAPSTQIVPSSCRFRGMT